jgi:hypothetical protein
MLLDRPLVLLGGHECAALAPTLTRALRDAERAGQHVDDAARDAIGEIAELAERWKAALGVGTPGMPRSTPDDEPETLSSMEVARIVGCSTRNVRALAQRGSLRGRRTTSGWLFDPVDVAAFNAARKECA